MEADKRKVLKTLDALSDTLGSSEGQSVEEIKEDLRLDGINVDDALARLQQAQQKISMDARRSALDAAREKRLALESKGNVFIGKFHNWSREQLIDRINDLIEACGLKTAVAYRGLESLGDEEIESILEDLEITHHRRNLEEGEDGE